MRTCDVEGCGRDHDSRGLCTTHKERLVRHGDPLAHIPINTSLHRAGGVLKLGAAFDLDDTGEL